MAKSSTFAARRLAALDVKLASLTAESQAWRELGIQPTSVLAMHRSQIEAVADSLDSMHSLIREDLGPKGEVRIAPGGVERIERRILAAIHIWESYRSKFAVRIEKELRDSLRVLDDLAWSAYEPACLAAARSGRLPPKSARMPPLVFPHSEWSPFARSREQAYDLDESTGVLRAVPDFDRYLRAIPVPLIGIPWYQSGHLPDAVFIGHEVGHIVEEDLALEDDLRAAVCAAMRGSDAARSEVWSRHWRSEVFADLYGVLTTGPAFVRTLVDLLEGGGPNIAVEKQPDSLGQWNGYPPRTLRVRLACEALRRIPASSLQGSGEFVAEADAIEAAWMADHPTHAMAEFDPDVTLVVEAMLCRPMLAFARSPGGEPLPISSAIAFTRKMQRAAEADAERVGTEGERPKAEDVRTLFASVALTFLTDSDSFRLKNANFHFRSRLLSLPQRRSEDSALPIDLSSGRHLQAAAALFARVDAAPR